MADIDNIICMISAIMTGQNHLTIGTSCDQSVVTLDSLTSGSVTIIGSTSSASSAIVSIPSTLGGYGISSATTTGYGAYASSESSSNTGLIVGLVVGIVALSTYIVIQLLSSSSSFTASRNVKPKSTPQTVKMPSWIILLRRRKLWKNLAMKTARILLEITRYQSLMSSDDLISLISLNFSHIIIWHHES
jgi:hypothetical protein